MSMSFGLAATLSNSQKLTPQMQQAIKLLQLSSLELAQEVQTKLDNNPLLERIEDDDDFSEADDFDDDDYSSENDSQDSAIESLTLEMWNSSSSDGDSFEKSSSQDADYDYNDSLNDSLDKLQQATIDSDAMDIGSQSSDSNNEFDAFDNDNFNSSSFDSGSANVAGQSQNTSMRADYDDFDSYQGATSACIQDHVRWQLNFKRLSDTDKLIANYLVDSMDDMGFIRLDIDELLQSLDTMASFYQWEDQVERVEIMTVLRVIQSCDPLGVGACNLSECLAIQLSKLSSDTQNLKYAQALLSASEYLVSNNIKALTQATGLQPEHITPALTLLRSLNPAPGLAFQSAQPDYAQAQESYDIPDVLVIPVRHHAVSPNSQVVTIRDSITQDDIAQDSLAQDRRFQEAIAQDDSWEVRLNPDTLPKLRINKEYANLVKRGDTSPDNQYLKDNLVDARLFIRSIEERNQNLLKVATSIIRHQQEFLRQGDAAMQPLILKDIAEEVELHESTVSRLTTSKSILTPQGLFSLKHFFSSHVSSSDGDVSSMAISTMIKQLIATENPKKPLSDSQIQSQLLTDGIDIARRTVAKYREAMSIGSSTQRKQKY